MKKLTVKSRIVVAVAALALVATYFIPVWQIALWAPQYPEGLTLYIALDHLSGDVEIINGLNHYIGMKHIKEDMFPEFSILPALVGILIAIGLFTAATGKWQGLAAFLGYASLFAIAALLDFYRWGYDYGHNLDPMAPIQVPGMAYQPPVLGYKNLLNFTAYSGPASGGWIAVGAGVAAALTLLYEIYRNKKLAIMKFPSSALAAIIPAFTLVAACSSGPEPIRYGKDACAQCKMTLTDKHFGAEVITQKGRVYKYDDLNCLVTTLQNGTIAASEIAEVLVIDWARPQQFTIAQQAFYLQHAGFKSPMRGDIAAFTTAAARDSVLPQYQGGTLLDWTGAQVALSR